MKGHELKQKASLLGLRNLQRSLGLMARIQRENLFERKKPHRKQYKNMHLNFPQILGRLLSCAKLGGKTAWSQGNNSSLKTGGERKQKFQLLFTAKETEFEFKSYELKRLGKHLRLSTETPEEPCHRSKEYIPVLKAKLKQTCTNKTHNQAYGN